MDEILQELLQGAGPLVVWHQPYPDACLKRARFADEALLWNPVR